MTLSGFGVTTTQTSTTINGEKTKCVLFFICNGMEVAQRILAKYFQHYMGEKQLEINHLPSIGMHSTQSTHTFLTQQQLLQQYQVELTLTIDKWRYNNLTIIN